MIFDNFGVLILLGHFIVYYELVDNLVDRDLVIATGNLILADLLP
jgi:hypothetical protein